METIDSLVTKEVPTFYFIGVTTRKSSIVKVFPLWMRVLGREDVVLEGIDLKIHDAPAAYRAVTAHIKQDPLSIGGLVTTHKVDLFQACRDLFEMIDPYARITGEVSSISKLESRLEAHAKDPITAGLSLDAILGKDYFGRTGGQVLIFGAGGSAAATLLHLMMKTDAADRPQKVILVNRSQPRLDSVIEMVARVGTDILVETICSQDPRANNALMAGLPECSLVINATGMGKDTPGSPVTDGGLFPRRGVAWEFNYRGELDFLHQALAQREAREITVEDGWLYFIHGWTQVIAQVLHVEIDATTLNRLIQAAETVRS
jgi:shikimate 5-dehydrogenase